MQVAIQAVLGELARERTRAEVQLRKELHYAIKENWDRVHKSLEELKRRIEYLELMEAEARWKTKEGVK